MAEWQIINITKYGLQHSVWRRKLSVSEYKTERFLDLNLESALFPFCHCLHSQTFLLNFTFKIQQPLTEAVSKMLKCGNLTNVAQQDMRSYIGNIFAGWHQTWPLSLLSCAEGAQGFRLTSRETETVYCKCKQSLLLLCILVCIILRASWVSIYSKWTQKPSLLEKVPLFLCWH